MNRLKAIKAPINKELEDFEPFFKEQLKSNIPLLSIITNYLLRRKGKQMRPMLVFLCAKLSGETSHSSFVGATLIELLHTATLIHDDVVDETYQRRGYFSINALWKSKIAVLVGDYFLARGLSLALDTEQIGVLKVVSEAVREMSEGELLQIEKSRKLDITEEVYYEIIQKKTATLIAACTSAGALSVKASQDKIDLLKQFGIYLGVAFQIRDDLFDYEKNDTLGKPTGNDIREKKMTLPLIYVLNNCDVKDRKKILSTIRKYHKNDKKVSEVIEYVRKHGGIEYTHDKMLHYRDKAIGILSEFEDCEAKDALIQLVHYTTERKK